MPFHTWKLLIFPFKTSAPLKFYCLKFQPFSIKFRYFTKTKLKKQITKLYLHNHYVFECLFLAVFLDTVLTVPVHKLQVYTQRSVANISICQYWEWFRSSIRADMEVSETRITHLGLELSSATCKYTQLYRDTSL